MNEILSRFQMALSKYVRLDEVSQSKMCSENSIDEISVQLQTEQNHSVILHVFTGSKFTFYSIDGREQSYHFRSPSIPVFSVIDILRTWFPQIQYLHASP